VTRYPKYSLRVLLNTRHICLATFLQIMSKSCKCCVRGHCLVFKQWLLVQQSSDLLTTHSNLVRRVCRVFNKTLSEYFSEANAFFSKSKMEEGFFCNCQYSQELGIRKNCWVLPFSKLLCEWPLLISCQKTCFKVFF
jgi:hypothetical protein